MNLLRKKRLYLLLLFILLAVLFYNSDWLGKMIYPIKYSQDIQISAKNHRIDPLLVAAIIRVESNYKTDLRSKKGAIGLMQLMPDTAGWIIEKAGYSKETMRALERADVNIEIGSWYLRSLFNQFSGNEIAVIAAYNAGPGKVKKWLEQQTWDGSLERIDGIPFGETRHYVRRVVYYYNKYQKIYGDEH